MINYYEFAITAIDQGRYTDAISDLDQALLIAQQSKDTSKEANVLNQLGEANINLGEFKLADSYLQEALTIFVETEDKAGEAASLVKLATLQTMRGDYSQGLINGKKALGMIREIEIDENEALQGLGFIYNKLGQYTESVDYYNQAYTFALEKDEKKNKPPHQGC